MPGRTRNYDSLKNEHAKTDHEKAAEPTHAKQPEQTWEERLDAKYEKLMADVTTRYQNNRINSREMVREERLLDQKKEAEIRAKMKEENKERANAQDKANSIEHRSDHTQDRERER